MFTYIYILNVHIFYYLHAYANLKKKFFEKYFFRYLSDEEARADEEEMEDMVNIIILL